MKNYYLTSLLIGILACLGCFPLQAVADPLVPDGVYYISCTKQDGFLGLGAYHDVDPYIYYVTNETERTDDAYWIVTNTRSGYTIRNEATGDLLVYTTGRVDKYYKYMTLASESLGDHSEYWNIILGDDGAFSIQSAIATGYYWNLRSGTNMVGTYNGSNGTAANERFLFHTKDGSPDPGPQPEPLEGEYAPIVFPNALHVCLKSGHIEAYPLQIITNTSEQGNKFVIETNIGRTFTYNLSDINSVSEEKPDFPTFNSFKFSKKTNDQVFSPVTGEIGDDSVIATIGAIGKRLTPTIELSDENATVYVNGKPQGEIGDRLRFDKDIYYLIAPEGCTILMADAYGNYTTKPYGRVMRVHVEWLTDRAEVPTIYINTSDGQAVTSKSYFKDATIRIDGHGIFPSMDETEVQIKGRGNSSWSWPKKPYRLKFAEKKKPLGLTNGKSWVLLSNYQTGSLMSNAIGMKAANLMGASGANHIVPVDLYLNGEYRGSYNFTEKVGFANNSIDIDDETYAAMLELDSYYDEPDGQKFRSSPYNLPVNVKEPDFSEGLTQLTLGTIQKDFNNFMMTLYRGQDISKHVDIEQLVRFLMVNELTLNYEFYHQEADKTFRSTSI